MDIVKEGLAVLGEEYGSLLQQAQDTGWIDVYETPGKNKRRYSWGRIRRHPYVLLNYRGDPDSVFTIAHDWGMRCTPTIPTSTSPKQRPVTRYFSGGGEYGQRDSAYASPAGYGQGTGARAGMCLTITSDQFRTTVVRQTMFAKVKK